ncbi:alpha/beta fold hydrolase [Mycobacterium sp. NPDC003449]
MTSTDPAGQNGVTASHTVSVPGARLHYEVRGAGPLLMVLAAPTPAAELAPLADALAGDHTVVITDPRGVAGAAIDEQARDTTPERQADDVAAILDDLGADRAHVFGASGGAVTALALATQHPQRVATLVAHEPPLLELLPGAAGPSAQEVRDATHLFTHALTPSTRYLPDLEALRSAWLLLGLGEESGHLVTQRTTSTLADHLGVAPVMFPGDHGGFVSEPAAFADTLREVLAQV